MKQMKRTLSLVLALVMLLSLGTTAFAGEVEEPVQVAEEVEQPVQPVVEAPVEAAPAAETPVEEAPAVETPVEEAPAVETPVEEAPAAETPVEEAPAAETPVEEVPVVEETEPAEEPVVNAIVGQPQDLTVVSGERAVFSVEVTGNAVSFQWQASRDNRRWSNMDAWFYGSSSELSFYPTRLDNGFYFRAVVTFENGEQMISEAARLSIASILITAQPEDLSVEPNTEAVFTVGAKGSVYYYQWQYSVNGSRWNNLNTRHYGSSNTLRFVAEAEDDGLYIRALVYARDGSRLATEAAKLTVAVNEPELEPEVTYEARTLAPEANVAGVALAVDAPEGALPSDAVVNIEAVNAASYEELTKALLGENTEISNALDINFSTEAEGEIEPKGDVVVYLTVPGISEKNDVSIVHISDSGVATKLPLIPAAELPRALGPDEIAFKSGEFSVYLIVDGKAPDTVVTYRHTYKFQDANGNPYKFLNKLGELTDEQIVKSDEVLYPIPDPVPADGKRFVRWEVNGEALQFETSVGKLTDDKVIIVTPKFEDVANVYFYEAPAGKEGENILLARKIVALNGSVLISDIVAPAGAEQVFVGWTDGTTEYVTKNAEGVIIETSIPSVAADLTLRPILKDAYWIRFNLGERGNGAKYVPAKFVIDTTDLSTLPTTTRTGYTFAGWYLDEAFTNQITDGNGYASSAQQAQLRSALETGSDTLYAKWEAVNTTMPVSVIIWGENANDTEYSYITTKNAGNRAVNATVTVNSNGRLTVNGSAVGNTLLTGFDNADYYNFDHATSTKVKATGTTVVEVFLNRKTYTWKFGIRESLNGWELTQRADGENWNTTSTYYGSITAKWDEDIRAQFKAMCENAYGSFKKTTYILFVPVTTSFNRNIWCDGNATTSDSIHIIGALTNMDKQDNQFWIYGINNEASVRYWTQNVDADATPYNISNYTQKTEANAGVDYQISGEDFIAIQGFTYSQNISEGTTIPSSGLDLYYTRNSYPVALYNVATGTDAAPTQLKEVQVQYEKVLGTVSDITSVTPSCPEQLDEAAYSFAGWFLSPTYSEGMQPVDLSTMEMPAGGIQLYAHWLPKYFLVKIDPNMGELYGEESTYTWIQYPGMLQRYEDVTTINYVKANGDGTHKYEIFTYDYWKSQGYTDQQIWDMYKDLARTAKYVEASGGAYKYEKDAYVLIGWYKLDANGNPESEPYDFGSVVREDMTIQAQWRRSGSYTFVYNATDSKTQATGTTKQDNGGYSDKATTTVLPAPTNVTDKYVFLGWDIVDGSGNSLVKGNLYKPGDDIIVDANWATANKTILVMARYESVYDSDDPIPVTYLKYNSNYPGGTTNVETDPVGYPLNTAIDLATAPAYTVNGYVLVGWSQNKDADPVVNHDADLGQIVFGSTDTVGIDSLTPTETVTVKVTVDGKEVTQEVQCNVLYAIWKRGEFYVYHSGVAGGNKETIQVPTSGTYDLTSNLTAGTLYGGYYLKGGFTAPSAGDDGVPTATCAAYDGDNWKWTTAQTVSGKALAPVNGVTYYIKEVPASKFLQPYTQYTYNRSNYDISTLWMISDIDDLNYQETGFYVLSANNKAKVCKSLKISTQVGSTTVTLKPENIFKLQGVTSNAYLTYLKMIDDALDPNLVADGDSVGMYWITNDGLFVTGTAMRTLTGVGNVKTLKKTDKLDVTSTITPVTPSSESVDP